MLDEYGKRIKHRLVDLGKTQTWLAAQVQERSGRYCDASLIGKVIRGEARSATITSEIERVLEITSEGVR